MANFKTTIITKKGHALMAKLSANVATMKFTKVCSSDFDYSNLNNSELEQVITFKNLKQTVLPDLITVVNTATVKVSATITNTNLNEGYYLRTIGLFALDPDDGEILYSITPTTEADYMAADNGITKSGISLELLTTISNSENVSLEVDPNAMISAETFNTVVGNVSDLENGSTNLVDGINKNTAYLNEKANKNNAEFTGTMILNTKDVATYEKFEPIFLNGWQNATDNVWQPFTFYKIGNICFIVGILESSSLLPDGSQSPICINNKFLPKNHFASIVKVDNEWHDFIYDKTGNMFVTGQIPANKRIHFSFCIGEVN